MECISSSFFCRFIGVPTVIKISDSDIVIEVESRVINIKWEDLIVPPLFHLSLFGQILIFKTQSRNYVFTMLAYNSKRLQKKHCEQLWASANIKRVEAILATVKKVITNRYLRQSSIDRIKLAVNQECKRWSVWLSLNMLNKLIKLEQFDETNNQWADIAKNLQLLSFYQNWNKQQIANSREIFINTQLQTHKAFFDKVELMPLTQQQRRACVIDNDNNLLLAGAGTGKTSVMVGRAGFLLNSLQAKCNDILLLAYGRKAADEMDERIKTKLSTDKISATTFHSVGLKIIAEVEGKKPKLSVFAEDEKAKLSWVQRYFEKHIDDNDQYSALVLEYFSNYYYVERSAFDFKNLGDCYQYFNDNNVCSFKGEQVNSFGELFIANTLFSYGIEYHYKAKYAVDVKTLGQKQYKPDFFLPQLNIYIEYFEVNEKGEPAPYIDQNAYYQGIEHIRATHYKHDTECLEFTYAQYQQGKLFSTLMSLLISRQKQRDLLPAKQIPAELILAKLTENGNITAFAKTLGQLVGLYKAACLDDTINKPVQEEVDVKKNRTIVDNVIANALYPKQTEKALTLLQPILHAYNNYLSSRGEIDFDDMINKALVYIKTGRFKSPWRYIMVDEFQDISEPRARLVKALRDNHKDCSVFAVGDDWQAIYRFSGADFTLTTQFANYFGATTQSELDQTFRFNNQIGQVATQFISKNPAQLNKTINSLTKVNLPAVSLLKRDSYSTNPPKTILTDEMANGAIDDVLSAISTKVCKPVSVYLLARFWFLLPNKVEIKRLNNHYPLLTIETQSFHASKGKEADYVIIVGLKKGANGFPSEKVASAVIDALLPKKETFEYAEERRLFYVALTRAKHRVYIIADMAESNCFVDELVQEHQIELDEFTCSLSQKITKEQQCLVCETGVLKKQIGRYGTFYACSHFPRCDYKESPCNKCDSPMTRKRYLGFKVCLNHTCKNMIPICEICQSEMVLRKSKRGEFWGCINYKGNTPLSCKNTVDNLQVNWPK
jgi:DNA helicase-4